MASGYHVAKRTARDSIGAEGLWSNGERSFEQHNGYEPGIYIWELLEDAERFRELRGAFLSCLKFDIWEVFFVEVEEDPFPPERLRVFGMAGRSFRVLHDRVPAACVSLLA